MNCDEKTPEEIIKIISKYNWKIHTIKGITSIICENGWFNFIPNHDGSDLDCITFMSLPENSVKPFVLFATDDYENSFRHKVGKNKYVVHFYFDFHDKKGSSPSEGTEFLKFTFKKKDETVTFKFKNRDVVTKKIIDHIGTGGGGRD